MNVLSADQVTKVALKMLAANNAFIQNHGLPLCKRSRPMTVLHKTLWSLGDFVASVGERLRLLADSIPYLPRTSNDVKPNTAGPIKIRLPGDFVIPYNQTDCKE